MNALTPCWICGKPAESREHIFKKSELVQAYGKGPFDAENGPAHVKDGVIRSFQGPDSKRVKYSPSLCQWCNNSFTQPFDKAYDVFVDWLFDHEENVLSRRFIDFQEVFGSAFEVEQSNLFKFFTKSFGCRLTEAGKNIPTDMVDLLTQERFLTALSRNDSIEPA